MLASEVWGIPSTTLVAYVNVSLVVILLAGMSYTISPTGPAYLSLMFLNVKPLAISAGFNVTAFFIWSTFPCVLLLFKTSILLTSVLASLLARSCNAIDESAASVLFNSLALSSLNLVSTAFPSSSCW